MSEQSQDQQPTFSLQRIYVKDLSFELPKTPDIFRKQWQPKVNLELNTANKQFEENYYEVILSLTVTATMDDEEVFIVEVQQAGIFNIAGLPEDQTQQTLGTVCPGILFPYARETIDGLVTKGSLPPLMLAPINFDAVYAEAVRRKEDEQAQA